MWYEDNKDELDYSKPIVAVDDAGTTYLLLPQIEKGNYKVIGYNWFNILGGRYDSYSFFLTAEEAVASRNGYTVCNGTLSVD
jgi:hypothetical protein